MKGLSNFTPLFTAGIFFIGFLALLLTGFNTLLNSKIDPVKEDITELKADISRIETKLDQLLSNKLKNKDKVF